MTPTREPFGTTPSGEAVERITLRNARGTTLQAITYGARISSLFVPDRHGAFAASAGGAIVASGAVHPTSTATTLRERDGRLVVGDGPFAETTEIVGGFYVLAGTRDEVVAVAAGVPVHPDGGVELRPIIDLDG